MIIELAEFFRKIDSRILHVTDAIDYASTKTPLLQIKSDRAFMGLCRFYHKELRDYSTAINLAALLPWQQRR